MAVVTERVADQRDTAPEFALIAKDVLKAFLSREKAVRAVDGISLAVRRREIYGLLGANGSGKSTLLRLLAALLAADSGEISVFGRDLKAEEMAAKRLVNRVAVDASFFKKLSALENLVYAGRMYGVPPALCRGRAKKVLERLGIGEKRHDEALEKLSRGMQQKVAIARSLLTSPALVLLDEPAAGLDIRSKREAQAVIRELRVEHDATIVLVTHRSIGHDRGRDLRGGRARDQKARPRWTGFSALGSGSRQAAANRLAYALPSPLEEDGAPRSPVLRADETRRSS